ncbi:MAG: TlpA family protein disulfide reductase [Arachidicoccus sp.]
MRYYRKIVIVIFVLCTACCAIMAQNNRGMPLFKIRLTNERGFTYKDIKKDIPVVLIYFSPTCDHCEAFARELVKHEKALQKKQIVMVCWEDLNQAKQFDTAFKLSSHSNIKIGSEGYSFTVQKYFNIQHYPFIAFYDSRGQLVKTVDGVSRQPSKLVSAIINF